MLSSRISKYFSQKTFEQRTSLALGWLNASMAIHNSCGSAGFYHPLKGWSAPYPETSGYLIPTLLKYHSLYPEIGLDQSARQLADWLCQIQLPNGTFHGGLLNSKSEPVVFDMGQILLGLSEAYSFFQAERYNQAIIRLTDVLIQNLEAEGYWDKWAYQPAYIPSYYTRVIWAVLLANTIIQSADTRNKMEKALSFYHDKVLPDHTVENWAFGPKLPAYTHTIAYTIRGFYESGHLLDDQAYIELARSQCDQLIRLLHEHGKLAGSYTKGWKGDYGFSCLSGNCQIAVLMAKLYRQTRNEKYLNAALKIFIPALKSQFLSGPIGIKGAIPGSAPIWGSYQRFRFPNWGVKFFLDAYLEIREAL